MVLVIRETRQLIEMGYARKIPSEVKQLVEKGKKLYKEALALKQVESFYNSIDSQIIPCQKLMLLNVKDQFKKKVKEKNMTWSTAAE